MAYRHARFQRHPTEAVDRGEAGRPLLVYGPAKRLLQLTPAVLGAPGVHLDPIDPHASIARLIEAFDEVLDLGLPNRLGRLVEIVRWKYARRRLLRPDAGTSHVAGKCRKLSPSAELMVDPEHGARCAIRDTGAPGEGRYH